MPQLLHYPQNARTLKDVAQQACNNPNEVENYLQLLCTANHRQPEELLTPFAPVILPEINASNTTAFIGSPCCNFTENQRITTLTSQIGGAATLALADLVWEITKDGAHNTWQFSKENLTTFGSGGGAATVKTSNMILDSIDNYQQQLARYESLRNHRAAPNTLFQEQIKLTNSYKQMEQVLNRKGQQFLQQHVTKTREVTNLTGRVVRESIPLTDSTYFRNLSNMAKVGKTVAPGLILLDGYLRYENVAELYRANNPEWKRQAVVESSSFGGGLAMAGAITTAVVLMTPAGLVVGFLIGGATAVGVDLFLKDVAGRLYDKL